MFGTRGQQDPVLLAQIATALSLPVAFGLSLYSVYYLSLFPLTVSLLHSMFPNPVNT